MTAMAEPATAIPFIDIRPQTERLRAEIDRRIAAVIDHGQFIMGPEVAELEAALAEFCGCRHAVSCSSGTDAIVLAMLARGVGRGDAVIVPSFTFAATAEAVALVGATPVFMDCDRSTMNASPSELVAALDATNAAGLNPVGVMVVDLFGLPADIDGWIVACREAGIWLIVDAAQSMGGSIGGRRVGGTGVLTTTSFFPAKPLGAYGDGGAVFTDDDDEAAALRSLRVHGQGSDKYDNVRIGLNARIDTLQAAILLPKLAILAEEIERRQQVAARYAVLREVCDVPNVAVPDGCVSAWAQYTIRTPRREQVRAALADAGIPTQVYYRKGVHEQTAYARYPASGNGMVTTLALCDEVLSLPMSPYLREDDQQRVVDTVLSALASAE